MNYLIIAYVVPAIVILVSIPMILGKVPPNRLYGFRTPKTLSSPDIWYPANRASGWFMTAAGLLALCCNAAVLALSRDWPQTTLIRWLQVITMAPLVLSLLASFLYVRRFKS